MNSDLCRCTFLFLLGKCLGTELLGYLICFTFFFFWFCFSSYIWYASLYKKRPSVPQRVSFAFPSAWKRAVVLVHFCNIVSLLGYYSRLVSVVAHCGFNLCFRNDQWCWASFHVVISHWYLFFGRNDYSNLSFFK